MEEILKEKNKFEIVRKYFILYPEKREELYNILISNKIIPEIIFDDEKIKVDIGSINWKSAYRYFKDLNIISNDIIWLLSRWRFIKYLDIKFNIKYPSTK